jgi:D-alanyl-D-alanine carboxypeptidase/D-alanyl-D-alanine-endopeptidase (penicillin-binding protein 4)
VRHAEPGVLAGAVGGVELARRDSAPLIEEVQVMLKVSQNLHAELLLRAVARARRGVGSLDNGLEEMRAFLKQIGVTAGESHGTDASGLSRLNLVAPSALVKLLQFMYRSPQRENWMSLLPVGGADGTLKLRFPGAAGRIRAKTGSLSHVNALSGYAERRDGSMLAFSVIANNQAVPAAEVRAVLDKIAMLLTE